MYVARRDLWCFYENRKPRAAVGAGVKAPLGTGMST